MVPSIGVHGSEDAEAAKREIKLFFPRALVDEGDVAAELARVVAAEACAPGRANRLARLAWRRLWRMHKREHLKVNNEVSSVRKL